jgi:hypothetical protein
MRYDPELLRALSALEEAPQTPMTLRDWVQLIVSGGIIFLTWAILAIHVYEDIGGLFN